MSWQKEKVLVTGSGGFIASHLAQRLVQQGAQVRAMVHYNSMGTWGWLDQAPEAAEMEVVAGDVTDARWVSGVVKGCHTVFHLAALIAIPFSYHAPGAYLKVNAEGTMNILNACLEHEVSRLVHTSTSETYGTARSVPIGEDHPLQAQSPYAASKIAADKLAESYHLSFGLPVVTVRPFNTYGPRQSARAVIPAIVTQCLAGGNLKLGNLHPTRDLNYVQDTVSGMIAAAQAPEAALGRVINLGSGKEISIGDLARMIIKLTGRDIEVETDEQRVRPAASEVERLLADNSLAAELLGISPRVDLEQGLGLTIEWMRSHQERYRAGVYAI